MEPFAAGTPDRIDLVQVHLALKEAFSTAATTVEKRAVVLIAAGRGTVTGWGECAPFPGHTTGDVDHAWEALTAAAPVLLAGDRTPLGRLPATARAGLAGALFDLAAREIGVPLWRRLGGADPSVEVSAAIGLGPDPIAAVRRALEEGYRHVKLKIAPGRDVSVVRAVRDAVPDIGIGVDGNGAYDREEARALVALDDLGVSYVEQPLAPDDLDGHADLRRAMATPLCLDESLPDVPAALAAIAAGAADVLNVKPGRLGPNGALRVHDAAGEAGLGLRVGGLIETGVGRAHALAVATLPGITLPADLTATGRWFAADPALPRTVMRHGRLEASATPGIGVDPDPGMVAAAAVRRASFA